MDIEKILQEYRLKKSLVDTTLARIEQYKIALAHPETWDKFYTPYTREIGMPGKPRGSGIPKSPVEADIVVMELTEETLKDWIKEDESRIFMKRLEVEQIEIALKCLISQEKYIIECKYFDNMFWKDIELNFNEKFRQKNYVTFEMLKKKNKEALDKLTGILEPFYIQFKIA